MGKTHSKNHIFFIDPAPKHSVPILFLHGLGSRGNSWVYQLERLSEIGFRPIAVDIPGFGESKWNQTHWSISETANELWNFMQELNLTRFNVVGISMGGTIAIQLSLNYPESIERLVLVNTFACLKPKRLNEWLYFSRRGIKSIIRGPKAQAEMVAWRVLPNENQAELRAQLINDIRSANPTAYRWAMISLAMFDVRNQLSRIQCPTLVISGDRDTTVPLQNQSELRKGIKNSEHIIIQNSGHAIIADQPEQFTQRLIQFLTSH